MNELLNNKYVRNIIIPLLGVIIGIVNYYSNISVWQDLICLVFLLIVLKSGVVEMKILDDNLQFSILKGSILILLHLGAMFLVIAVFIYSVLYVEKSYMMIFLVTFMYIFSLLVPCLMGTTTIIRKKF